VARTLAAVIEDQEQAFAALLEAQRRLEELNRDGRQMGLVDGETSDVDEMIQQLHTALHQLETLSAEALQSAMSPSA